MFNKAIIYLLLVCASRTVLSQGPEEGNDNTENGGSQENQENTDSGPPAESSGSEAGESSHEEGTFEEKAGSIGDSINDSPPMIKYPLYPVAIIARPLGRYTDETIEMTRNFLNESWATIKKYLMDNYDAIVIYVQELMRTIKEYAMERYESYKDIISGIGMSTTTLTKSIISMDATAEPANRRKRDISDAMESLDPNAGILKRLGYPYRNVPKGVVESTNDILLEIGNQLFRAVRKVVLPVIVDTLEPFRDSPRVPALVRSAIDNLVVSYKLLAVVNLVGPNA